MKFIRHDQARDGDRARGKKLRPWQQALLILGLVWALLVVVPDFYRLQGSLGTLGFSADNDGNIYELDGPPASTAVIEGRPGRHLQPEDKIDLTTAPCWHPTTKECRDFLAVFGGMGGLAYVRLGTTVELPFLLKEGDRFEAQKVTLKAEQEKSDSLTKFFLTKFLLAFDEIIAVLVLWRAFSLVWSRPSRMTVGFFLFVMWFNPGQYFTFYALLQPYTRLLLAQESLQALAQGAGYAGFLIFALRFPHDQTEPRFQPVERIAITLGATLVLLQLLSFLNVFGARTEFVTRWAIGGGYAVAFTAFYIVWRRRELQSKLDYQRIRWVLWGCAIGIPAFVIADSNEATSLWAYYVWPLSFWQHWQPDEWVFELGFLMSGALTFLICEAVRKPRIINISYELRGWIAGGVVLVLVTIIELNTHARMESSLKEANIPELAQFPLLVGIALFGGWAGHKGAHVADHWFNHQLYHATTELQRTGLNAKRHERVEEVDAILAAEPVKLFNLTSAAVFREEAGGFARVAIAGDWQKDNRKGLLSAEDKRTVHEVSEGRRVSLSLPYRDENSSTSDLTAPALAIPVLVADSLYAIAMYGPHATGDDIDPLEAKALEEFAQQIAIGYETAKMKTLERENRLLRDQVSHLGVQAPKPA